MVHFVSIFNQGSLERRLEKTDFVSRKPSFQPSRLVVLPHECVAASPSGELAIHQDVVMQHAIL